MRSAATATTAVHSLTRLQRSTRACSASSSRRRRRRSGRKAAGDPRLRSRASGSPGPLRSSTAQDVIVLLPNKGWWEGTYLSVHLEGQVVGAHWRPVLRTSYDPPPPVELGEKIEFSSQRYGSLSKISTFEARPSFHCQRPWLQIPEEAEMSGGKCCKVALPPKTLTTRRLTQRTPCSL